LPSSTHHDLTMVNPTPSCSAILSCVNPDSFHPLPSLGALSVGLT
jgi:hypothetical protein